MWSCALDQSHPDIFNIFSQTVLLKCGRGYWTKVIPIYIKFRVVRYLDYIVERLTGIIADSTVGI